MRFWNWRDMYDFVAGGRDLWSPETGTYVFAYNDRGALATYSIDAQEAASLNASGAEYWGEMLGRGGCILDNDSCPPCDESEAYLAPSHEFCKAFCNAEWVECADKLAVEIAASAEIAGDGSAEPMYTVAVRIIERDGGGEALGDESLFLELTALGAARGCRLTAFEPGLIPCSELEAAVEAAKTLARAELGRRGGRERFCAQLWVSCYDTAACAPLDGIELAVD